MGNWIENNPVKSLTVYTITIAAATWAISTFVLRDNRDELHKEQVDNLNNHIEVQREKIGHLEFKNTKLHDENQKYLEWLRLIPQSTQFFTSKIAELEKEIASVVPEVNPNTNTEGQTASENAKYRIAETRNNGQTFIDGKTGVTISFNVIHADRTGDGTITLPGKVTETLSSIRPGQSWQFKYDDHEYVLVVKEINYIRDEYKIDLRQL